MDKKMVLLPALALGALTSSVGVLTAPALAEPVALSEAQMDRVTAGATQTTTVNVTNTNENTNTNTNTASSSSSITLTIGTPPPPPPGP